MHHRNSPMSALQRKVHDSVKLYRRSWDSIAESAGLSFVTVASFAVGKTRNPHQETIDRLSDVIENLDKRTPQPRHPLPAPDKTAAWTYNRRRLRRKVLYGRYAKR